MNKATYWVISFFLFCGMVNCTSQTSEAKEQATDPQSSEEISSVTTEDPPRQTRIIHLSPDEFEQQIAQLPEVTLIDARTAAEFATGHIPGALNIDVKSSDFKEKIKSLDPNRTYMVNCLSGIRSTRACSIMKDEGFTSLYNLEGGVRAWEKAGKELVKP